MKNDLYIPLLSTPLRVRTRIPVWRDREKALSTIGSWSSSRDGLMLDRSLSLSRVGSLASSGSQKRYPLTSYIEQVEYVYFYCARPIGGDICLRENLIIARNHSSR